MLTDAGAWIALCGMALGLGVRHGFDADHLAVIDGIARRNIKAQPLVARFSGVLFAAGHGAVVLTAAVAAVTLASRWRIPAWLEITGTLISVAFLLTLGALNLWSAWSAPQGAAAMPVGFRSRFLSSRASDPPLGIVAVGMLFAISFDTLSQATALSLAAAHFGGLRQALLATGCFALGMLTAGGLNGVWISHLIATASRRAVIASRVMTSAVGAMNLGVGCLALATLASPAVREWAGRNALLLGAAVILAVAAAFGSSMWFAERFRIKAGTRSLALGRYVDRPVASPRLDSPSADPVT